MTHRYWGRSLRRVRTLRLVAIAIAVAITLPVLSGLLPSSLSLGPLRGGSIGGVPAAIAQVSADQLSHQGDRQFVERQYEAAAERYRQALAQLSAQGDPNEIRAHVLDRLSTTYLLLDEYEVALPILQEFLAAQSQVGYGTEPILSNLGLVYFHLGRFAEAEARLEEAIAGWEEIRSGDDLDAIAKITLFEQQSYTYNLLLRVLVAQDKSTEALLWAERGRARALVEQLAQQHSQTQVNLPTLAEMRQIAQTQQATVVNYGVIGDGRRVLGNEIETETDLFIWVISPEGTLSFQQVPLRPLWQDIFRSSPTSNLSPLENLVRLSRDGMGVGERGIGVVASDRRYQESATSNPLPLQHLYQMLIAPIADQLPSDANATVVFIPQGPLFLVPFASLQGPDGSYLVEHHAIALSPSIQVLGLGDQRPWSPEASELIVGNPVTMPTLPPASTLPSQSLPPLPGAEREAQAIGTLLGSAPLIGPAATETAVVQQMPEQAIIHLATHGLLNLDPNLNEFGLAVDPNATTAIDSNVFVTPGAVIVGEGVTVGGVDASVALARERVVRVDMPGVLALAPSAQDDGWLTAEEIAALDLDAHLVVLSACDTGRGRITGDGVVGLPRAFLAAGADNVMVSLWQVPDAATAELMVSFYEQLIQGQGQAQALRQAMLSTQANYPDPRNWSAFVLVQ